MRILLNHTDRLPWTHYTEPFARDYCARYGYELTIAQRVEDVDSWRERNAACTLHVELDACLAPLPWAPSLEEFAQMVANDTERSAIAVNPESLIRFDPRWAWPIGPRFQPEKHCFLFWCARLTGRGDTALLMAERLWAYWYDQPRCRGRARVLCELLADRRSEVLLGAEIGVAEGALSSALLGYFPRLHLLMVDTWCEYAGTHPYRLSGDKRSLLDQPQQNAALHRAWQRTQFAAARREIRWVDSRRTAATLPDECLDFVFIDADHTYAACRSDLEAYFPKVRRGGLFAGHDYGHRRHRGVKQAVDEFFAAHNLALRTEESIWSTTKP